MNHRIGLGALAVGLLAASAALGQSDVRRSGYTYVRDVSGDATVESQYNGRVEARRNMPLSVGDEVVVSDSGRAEIELADGNLLHVGGRTHARLESLSAQQGEDDTFSAIKLSEGSVILSAIGANEQEIPRIDTDEATVYLSRGARARVNADRRGTVVIARAGAVEVRTRDGSTNLRPGQYLMVRDGEEPEVERGSFSRDRLDLWAAERLDAATEVRSASARYVDEQYQSDVSSLDGYGDWSYNDTTSSYVWSPRVSEDWSPYSYGSWYYTPAGLTWWSYDPWGWYPFHYGNWFFEASWHRWCWAPASIYSPAWVYWGFTPSYIGWCPIGYYSFFSPWYDTYYRRWGWGRPNLYLSIRGTFDARHVDFRGWNFVGAGRFTTAARMDVIPGSRIADRLGSQVAISSRPIVVNARPGGAREAIHDYVREAPRLIERSGPGDTRLAPILARERTLPAASVQALREHAVVAERGRLAGAAAADLAPRGALVDRGRTSADFGRREPTAIDRGRIAPESPRSPRALARDESAPWRGRGADALPSREAGRPDARVVAPAPRSEDWRSRGGVESRQSVPRDLVPRDSVGRDRVPRNERAAPQNERIAPQNERVSPQSDWRTRSIDRRSSDGWRPRSEVPPARRVIDGAVPGRRPDFVEQPQTRENAAPEWRARDRVDVPRREYAPQYRRAEPPAPRSERAPMYSAPPPRVERAPAYSAPAPRSEGRRSAPPPPPSRGDRSRKQ